MKNIYLLNMPLKYERAAWSFIAKKNSEIHKRILVNKEDKGNYELNSNGEQDVEIAWREIRVSLQWRNIVHEFFHRVKIVRIVTRFPEPIQLFEPLPAPEIYDL